MTCNRGFRLRQEQPVIDTLYNTLAQRLGRAAEPRFHAPRSKARKTSQA